MTFKGVLIDFGDTLAYRDEVRFRAYEDALVTALKKCGIERRPDDLASALAGAYLKSSKGELNDPREFWSLTLEKLGIHDRLELPDVLEIIKDKHEAGMFKLYDGVAEILSILREKYKLALVSNCAAGTDKLIRSLGIADFFNCITLSYQVGARKPDKRLYLAALKCLGLRAVECVFVADEISDLEGARNVGLKTVLLLQGNSTFSEAEDPNFEPDFRISRVSEVTDIL